MSYPVERRRIPLALYRNFVRWMPIPTVDVVILSPDKKTTLVGLRNNRPAKGTWYTIGGRLQKHEDLLARAVRAVREETGLRIRPQDLTFIGVLGEEFADSAFGNMSTHCLNIYFGIKVKAQHLVGDQQHAKLDWLPLRSKHIHPEARHKILHAAQIL